MEEAIAQHRRELDDILSLQADTVDQYAKQFASQTQKLEVTESQVIALTASLKALAQAAVNPYNLILFAYVLAVVLQLVFLSRSASKGRWSNVFFGTTQAQTYAILTFLSLASTWFYMFAYLFSSYEAFLNRVRLAGQEVASIPACPKFDVSCFIGQATARLLRSAQWLSEISLFEEAWLSVLRQPLHWLWSIEVCLFCVSIFALYVVNRGSKAKVPFGFAYMILGQSCAISVSYNLFNLALAVREGESATAGNSKRSDAALMPPPPSPSVRSKKGDGKVPTVKQLFQLALVATGLYFVLRVPNDLLSLLYMHAAPMVLTLPIFSDGDMTRTNSIRISFTYAVIGLSALALRTGAIFKSQAALSRMPEILFENPAQSSISFDTICIHISVMAQLAFAKRWLLVALTPLLGPTATLSFHLSLQERLFEAGSFKTTRSRQSRTSRAAASNDSDPDRTPSARASSRRQSVATSASESDASSIKGPKRRSSAKSDTAKTRKSKSRSAKEGAMTTTSSEVERITDTDDHSDAISITDTPAARAKRSRPRPRKQAALDGLELPSEASGIAEKKANTRLSKKASLASSAGSARPRGRPRKGD